MTKIRTAAFILLAAALALPVSFIYREFPLGTDELIAKKYTGWSGVIRVWIHEGWSPGRTDAAVWLNRCAAPFEKAHEGVYIHVQQTDAAALTGLCENGVIPPDIILFPPGALEDPSHLVPLDPDPRIRSGIADTGMYGGIVYALPVLMGGYAWAYNDRLIEDISDTRKWQDSTIALPPDDDHRRFSTALAALCSGRYLPAKKEAAEDVSPPGVDLGLPLKDDPPVSTPEPIISDAAYEYCALPDKVISGEDAFSSFIAGNAAAVPVTQKELQHLSDLSESGRGPDWKIRGSGDIAYSDQLLFVSLVNRSEEFEKTSLCRSFIDHILSDEAQQLACVCGAFSVTDAMSGYRSGDPYVIMEDILRTLPLCARKAFSSGEEDAIDFIVREFYKNKGFTPELYRDITALCG